MKVHVISESLFFVKGTGVHTAFIDHIELLKEKGDIEVVINGKGTGDVFHSHTYGLYYIWKGRKYKGRRVFTAHVIPASAKGSLPLWWLLMPFVKFGLKIVYSYADVCIALSPVVEKAIQDSGAKTRIIKIYNPINVEKWKRTDEIRKEGRKMMGLSDEDFVVLGVGQIAGRKGVEDFLDIAEAVPEAKFVWAGGRPFGALTEGIARINKRLKKTGENFILSGEWNFERMPYIYAAGDLMLFTSYQETFGLAPLEAAASGMPVIYRDIEVYKLLYENLYLKAENIEGFANLTRKMMQDKMFYDEGLDISKQLLKQFDRNYIREKLITLYKDLVENSLIII